ncbi:unnamed protein product [Paramecium sonneborni]|uniref:Mini antigen n=1 Tax=Paramecium sonneborni TaxID=65129 RepID=A0A8S1LUD2_9CILI|nr:unnamed protein product [Paramecium sonneborni]
MRIFLIVGLITMSLCVQFSLLQMCACSEYGQTLCELYHYCSWNGTTCVDMDCQYLKTDEQCTGHSSDYKCKWHTDKCESHNYTCADFDKEDCGQKIYGFDCMWVDEKCQDFSCTSATEEDCSPFSCQMTREDNTCKEPQSLDCSSFSTAATCDQSDGYGNMCYFNDNSKCTQYDFFSTNCTDYSDVQEYCNQFCTYDDTSKTCKAKSCSDFINQHNCTIQLDLPGFKIIPCTWNGTTCYETTASELEQLDMQSCMNKTMVNYKWSFDNNKCTACTQFTSNPAFKYLSDYLKISYGFQIITIVIGLSLILN